MWWRTVVATLAGLTLLPMTLPPATAHRAPAGPASETVGLWGPDFSARMGPAQCEVWGLDARGFCVSDDVRNGVELGMKFRTSRSLTVTGVRLYRVDLGSVSGSLWDADGTRLATGTFAAADTTGWQDLAFPGPVAISPGRTYVVSYYSPATQYAFAYDFFRHDELVRGPVTALRAVDVDPNGVHCYDSASCPSFPQRGFRDSNYWITPLWVNPPGEPVPGPALPGPPGDVEPPRVHASAPGDGARRVSPGATVRVTFTEPVRSALLTRGAVRLLRRGGTTPVRVRARYDTGRHRLVLDPSQRLRPGVTYRVVISTAVVDLAGNRLDQDPRRAGAQRATWTFRVR